MGLENVKLTSKDRFKLKHFIKELQKHSGRGTELVSVYVPAGYELVKIVQHLQQEQGTASNIKSSSTRKNVTDALERMIQHLKLIDKTPPNGFAAFSGNVSEREGQPNIQVFSLEPPIPMKLRLYRCEKNFILDPLEELVADENVFGMIVVDKREGDVALLKGKNIVLISHSTSDVPGKHKSGGQCLDPNTLVLMESGELRKIKDVEIGDCVVSKSKEGLLAKSTVLDKWLTTKKQIYKITTSSGKEIVSSKDHLFLVNGNEWLPAEQLSVSDTLFRLDKKESTNGLTQITIIEENISSIEIEDRETDLVDISVEAENFIANGLIVHNSAARFERLRDGAAKDFYRRVARHAQDAFFPIREQLRGILLGGPGGSKQEFLDQGDLTQELKDKIIATKDLSYTGEFGLQELLEKSQDVLSEEEVVEEKQAMQRFFFELSKSTNLASYGRDVVLQHLQMGAVDTLLLSESLSDEDIELFSAEADKIRSKVILVSLSTREGAQLKEMGKFAAILRYPVES